MVSKIFICEDLQISKITKCSWSLADLRGICSAFTDFALILVVFHGFWSRDLHGPRERNNNHSRSEIPRVKYARNLGTIFY